MFEAKIKQAAIFRKLMESLKELMKEGSFDCSSNGIALQGVDSSFVALIQLTLRADGFEQYRVDHNLNLGVNIEHLLKILKCAGANDSMTLKSADNDKLTVLFESEQQDRVSQFDLNLTEIEADTFSIPPTTYGCVVKMDSAEFQRICRDLSNIGENIEITVSKGSIKFAVVGTNGSGNIVLKQGEGEKAVEVKVEDKITQLFPLRYLNFFAKASSFSETVSLMLHEEVPLVAEFKVGDLGHLRYFLAPKVDEQE